MPRVNLETPSDADLPVPNAPEIGENYDEYDEDNKVLAVDEVLDAIDADEGLEHEEILTGNSAETGFEDAGDIRSFGHEYCPDVVKMHHNNFMSCLDLFTCVIVVDFTQKFVSTTNYFGPKCFGCKWKTLDVQRGINFRTYCFLV